MKSKRQRMAINWPYSFDPQTQAYLAATAASYTYAWIPPPSSPGSSTYSLIPLPTQLYFAASTSNPNSITPSSVSPSSSVNNHACCMTQPSAPNRGSYTTLGAAAAATTSKIQYSNNNKMAASHFLALDPSNINNSTAPFSQLQEHIDIHRHYSPCHQYEQQNGYRAFLTHDSLHSNGFYSQPPSHSDYTTWISNKPIISSSDNAEHVATIRVNGSSSETESMSSDTEIVVDDENDTDVTGNSKENEIDTLNEEQKLEGESKHRILKCYANRVRGIFRPF